MFGKKTKSLAGPPEAAKEQEGVRLLKEFIAPPAIKLESNYIQIGRKYARTLFTFTYPRFLRTAWLAPIINLNQMYDITLFIHPSDSGAILKGLESQLAKIEAEMQDKEQKGYVRDPMLETAHNDIEELRDRIQQGAERFFRFGLYFTIYADDPKELTQFEKEFTSILENRLVYARLATFQQEQGFNSLLPIAEDQLHIDTEMNTGPLSTAFPFISSELSSNKGILYGINRHNNSLIIFDRFSMENANSVIFGKSGGGKSLLWSEPTLVKDNQGVVKWQPIGQIVEKIIAEKGIDYHDEELEGKMFPGFEVYTFDSRLKGRWAKVSVAARKKAPALYYKFTTRSGRTITTTADHNMVVLQNGAVRNLASAEIKSGQTVPLPRFLPEPSAPLEWLNLLKVLAQVPALYVQDASAIINSHYKTLKSRVIDQKFDKYLYKYRQGRRVPLAYFQKILNWLELNLDEAKLAKLKITTASGRATLPARLPMTAALARLWGYIIAEGAISQKLVVISATDPETRQNIKACLNSVGISWFETKTDIRLASRVFLKLCRRLGVWGRAGQKAVPPILFNASNSLLAEFLKAYYQGDGWVDNEKSVMVVSKSKQLISELAVLLYRFGIVARLNKKKKKAPNWQRKRVYYELTVSGSQNLKKFADKIGFAGTKKTHRLEKALGKKANTNVDVIPEIAGLVAKMYDLFPPLFWGLTKISAWKNKKYQPSPEQVNEMLDEVEARLEKFNSKTAAYEELAALPNLDQVIAAGRNNKELNRQLWQTLGQSWRVVKNEAVSPGFANALAIIQVAAPTSHCLDLPTTKQAIHAGFKEMGINIQSYNRSLQAALVARPTSNTNYEMLQKAGHHVWHNYREILTQKIPLIREKIRQLNTLANSDLFWDPIVAIEKFKNKKDQYVYDLTVDNEVFLAGQGGLFVHNSYATKLEIIRSLMVGTDVLVIDPENEYEYLAETVGGTFFKISLTSPHHINPFDLPPIREDDDPTTILRENIIDLVALMKIMLGGLSTEEDALLDKAVRETYASRDITEHSDFSGKTVPLLSDLQQVLGDLEGGKELALKLSRFTEGRFSGFFNQQTNVDISRNLVVFNIRDMEEDLRPVAMYIILNFIWKRVRVQLKKRLLFVDEAWWLLQHEESAAFLFSMAKRARKYYLGLTTITQDINDFMKSRYGEPIITNSSIQLLFKQSPATIDIVQRTFNLTDEEKYVLLQSKVGEGIFFAGLKHAAVQVVASYSEDQIITSDPAQLMKIEEAKRQLLEQGRNEAAVTRAEVKSTGALS